MRLACKAIIEHSQTTALQSTFDHNNICPFDAASAQSYGATSVHSCSWQPRSCLRACKMQRRPGACSLTTCGTMCQVPAQRRWGEPMSQGVGNSPDSQMSDIPCVRCWFVAANGCGQIGHLVEVAICLLNSSASGPCSPFAHCKAVNFALNPKPYIPSQPNRAAGPMHMALPPRHSPLRRALHPGCYSGQELPRSDSHKANRALC